MAQIEYASAYALVGSKYLPNKYLQRPGEQTFITENDVHCPPAAHIIDKEGNIWGLGYNQTPFHDAGHFAFNVLRGKVGVNAPPVETGEWADHIEMKAGKITIHTITGFKTWTGNQFV